MKKSPESGPEFRWRLIQPSHPELRKRGSDARRLLRPAPNDVPPRPRRQGRESQDWGGVEGSRLIGVASPAPRRRDAAEEQGWEGVKLQSIPEAETQAHHRPDLAQVPDRRIPKPGFQIEKRRSMQSVQGAGQSPFLRSMRKRVRGRKYVGAALGPLDRDFFEIERAYGVKAALEHVLRDLADRHSENSKTKECEDARAKGSLSRLAKSSELRYSVLSDLFAVVGSSLPESLEGWQRPPFAVDFASAVQYSA